MGLALMGGYYNKEDALKILNNMKYYKRNLELIKDESESFIGLIPAIRRHEEKMYEDYLVEKLKIVKSVLDKNGNEAIDAYIDLTKPDETHFLQPLKSFFEKDEWLTNIFDELSIPMNKDEFEHYLDIYNQFYK